MRLMTLVEHGIRDVRYATRALARDRGFTVVAVATLALGLGANTAIFAVLYNAVLRPLPYERPESLMHVRRLTTSDQRGARPISFSYSEYLDLSRDARAFEAVAAYARRVLTLSGRAHPEQVTAEIVSPSYLPLLGIQPALGRAFTTDDDRTGAAPAAITSHALWQSRFGARADALGGPIRLNGSTFTIVGVAPRGFKGDSGRADVWLTAAAARDVLRSESPFEIIARRRPSATSAEADSEVRAFVARLHRSNAGTSEGTAVPLAATRRDPQLGSVLGVLCGAVSFIVLIACANVANLLLARGIRRRREIAIRLSLGAGRGAILRQLLTESLLLSVAGAGAGFLLAVWILEALAALQPAANAYVWPTFTRGLDVEVFGVNGTVLLFCAGSALVTTVICGLMPAGILTRSDVRTALSAVDSAWSSRRGGVPWRGIIAGQVALVLVLLAGAGLMLRSFSRLLDRPIGIDPRGIMTFRISLPYPQYRPETGAAFFERFRDRVTALPGVEQAASVRHLPLIERGTVTTLQVPGRTESLYAGFNAVDPEFFRLFRVSLREGRFFDARDDPAAPPVVIVTESAARSLFGSAGALGRRIVAMGTSAEIVGVVADIRYEPQRPQLPIIGDVYVSLRQRPAIGAYVAVRAAGDPRLHIPAIRAIVAELDPELPMSDITLMIERLRSVQSYARFTTLVLSSFAALALALAVIGIAGTVGYSVASRRREVGIRMALGAPRSSVVKLFVRDGLTVCGGGAVVGMVLAVLLTRQMRTVLYETAPDDPLTFVAAFAVLASAATLACVIPARRAASVDPSLTLRQ